MYKRQTDIFAIDDDELKVALKYIRDNVASDINVAEVANACHISRRLLELKFRRHLACSPGDAIRKARLEHILRLLYDTDKSITSIASECGFTSTASLCQAFQKHYGESPGRLRQNIRGD